VNTRRLVLEQLMSVSSSDRGLLSKRARVNLCEADFFGNHCVVAVSSFGWLIQAIDGSAGGVGGLRTNRSGCSA